VVGGIGIFGVLWLRDAGAGATKHNDFKAWAAINEIGPLWRAP
jgi:hypothetical protein